MSLDNLLIRTQGFNGVTQLQNKQHHHNNNNHPYNLMSVMNFYVMKIILDQVASSKNNLMRTWQEDAGKRSLMAEKLISFLL